MSRAKSDKIYTVPPEIELRILEFIWEVESASTKHIQRMVEREQLCGETQIRRTLANIHKQNTAYVKKAFTGHTTKGRTGTGEAYIYTLTENTNIRIQELKTEIEKRKSQTIKAEMYGSQRFYLHSVKNELFLFTDDEGTLYKPRNHLLHGYLNKHHYGFKFCTIFTNSLSEDGKVYIVEGEHTEDLQSNKWDVINIEALGKGTSYHLSIHPELFIRKKDRPKAN